jgi:hypothetical protein
MRMGMMSVGVRMRSSSRHPEWIHYLSAIVWMPKWWFEMLFAIRSIAAAASAGCGAARVVSTLVAHDAGLF